MTVRARIDKVLKIALVVLMSALVLDVVWQVASRYIFNNPSSFTDELATFLMIWVGLAGAAYVKGQNQHLAIDILHTKLTPLQLNHMMIFINFLVIVFSLTIMVIGGSWLVYTRFVLGQLSAALQIPVGYVYGIVPISGLLMVYYAIDDIAKLVKNYATLKQQ
ncbi:MAG TPA: TRAP transporter small permease [Bacteroidales bacterium]|nr:TRAP transporter small permease [Bacteroidales bacterium]